MTALNLTTWTPVGPDAVASGYIVGNATLSGRVNAIAISPNFDGHGTQAMFLGTAHGGVWRSTNFASIAPAWVPLTDNVGKILGLPPEQQVGLSAIGALAVDPNHPGVVYAGTGDFPFGEAGGGILKSTDGGNTWSLIGQSTFAGQRAINKIIVDPTDISGNTLYASRADGIFKSPDAGVTWQSKMNGLDAQVNISDIAFAVERTAELVIYAGVSGGPASARGIWQLIPDADDTWHQMPIDLIDHTGQLRTPDDIGTIKLSIIPFTFGPLAFAAISNTKITDPTHFGGVLMLNVFKFTVPSPTWTPVTNFPDALTQNGYAQSIGLAPDGTAVYVGWNGAAVSTDGGKNWTSIDVLPSGQAATHSDEHCWAFDQSVAYAGNDGGIWRYDLASGKWQSLNTAGLQTFLTTGASASPTDLNVLIAAAQDNGENLRQSSGSWLHIGGVSGDGGRVRFDPDPAKGGKTIYELTVFGKFYRSDDTGVTFTQLDQNIPGAPPGGFEPGSPFAIDPANTSRLLVGSVRAADFPATLRRLYETSDQGRNWKPISGELSGGNITAVAYAPSNDSVIYVAYEDKVFRTTNDGGPSGTDWQQVDAATPFLFAVSNITVDPLDWQIVYATAGSRVWRTLDGGASPWQDVGGNLPNLSLNALVIYHAVRNADPTLLVGNEVGFFASHKPGPGAQWELYGVGLPEARITDLEFDTRTLRLTVGTWGRGVFQILLPRVLTKINAPPVAFGAYDNPSDGFQHALIATADGLVTERYFGNPTFRGGEGPLNAASPLTRGLVGVAGYFNPVDGYQHALAATSDGFVHELRYANRTHPGNFVDPQGPVHWFPVSIVALAGYFNPADGFQHAIVATSDGVVTEVFFGNPQFPGQGVPVLATFQVGIVGVAGYHDPQDGFQHALVATLDGALHEIKFANPAKPGTFVDPQGPLHHFDPASPIVALAGYFNPADGFQHGIVATRDGKVIEVAFGNPKFPGVGVDLLATFDSGTLSGLGAYATTDGFQHILVLQSDGVVSELRFRPDVGFQTSTS